MNPLLIIAGVLLIAAGFFVNFAAGMASVPDERLGKRGCAAMVVGLIMLGVGLWRALV